MKFRKFSICIRFLWTQFFCTSLNQTNAACMNIEMKYRNKKKAHNGFLCILFFFKPQRTIFTPFLCAWTRFRICCMFLNELFGLCALCTFFTSARRVFNWIISLIRFEYTQSWRTVFTLSSFTENKQIFLEYHFFLSPVHEFSIQYNTTLIQARPFFRQ